MSISATKPTWDNDKINVNDVKAWIGECYNNSVNIKGPIEVYRSNDWGITASFEVSEELVVCKIGFLPIFEPSPEIYQLLNKSCPDHVPKLIHSKFQAGQTWMLFKPFVGEIIRNIGTLDALLDMTRTMADIQIKSANNIDDSYNKIPRYPVSDMPKLFDILLEDIQTKYLSDWISNKDSISNDFNISMENLERISDMDTLLNFKESVIELSKELEKFSIPNSIDHIDLHTNNGILQSNGEALIFDWEEASISCPFFSLDKLLNDSKRFDNPSSPSNEIWSKSQLAVRDAYLENIPWLEGQDKGEKEYAFDIAMCLSQIKYAYQGTFFIEQVGWESAAAGLIAESIVEAILRYDRFKAKYTIKKRG